MDQNITPDNVTRLVPPEVARQMQQEPVPEVKESEKPAISFDETDKLLELTDEENTEAPASAGVRGQMKKILRSFKDDFQRNLEHNHTAFNGLHRWVQISYGQFQSKVLSKLQEVENKTLSLYSSMVRGVMIPLENRLVIVDTGAKALLDYVADKFFVDYQSHHQFAGEIIALRNRVAELEEIVVELKGGKRATVTPEVHPELNQDREKYIKGFRDDVESLRAQIEFSLRERAKEQMKATAEGAAAQSGQVQGPPTAPAESASSEQPTEEKKEDGHGKEETSKEAQEKPEKIEEVK